TGVQTCALPIFIYLYPKRWRKRYGVEFIEVLKQTDFSFKTVFDLFLGAIDAWDIELRERDIYGYGISQMLVVVATINAFIILNSFLGKEGVVMEKIASIVVLIAMASLFLAVCTFIVSLFKFGLEEGFSIRTKLTKVSLGLMGVYAVTIGAFLIIIN